MTRKQFPWMKLIVRFAMTLVLVFTTYNPEGYSYYHWIFSEPLTFTPPKILAGIALLIGWTVFVNAAYRALGLFGLVLLSALFGALIWTLLYYGWISIDSPRVVTYLVMICLCALLAVGSLWSHIWFRFSGQRDVDDVED